MINGPGNLGRFTKGEVVTWKFSVMIADLPTLLGTSPAISALEDGNATPFTGGITFTPNYAGVAGLVEVVANTGNAAFHAGKHYDFYISAGVANLVSQVGAVVGHLALIPEPVDVRM